MFLFILAKKICMTSVYYKGEFIPVTIIHVYNNYILNIKKINSEYMNIQTIVQKIKIKNISKPCIGYYKKYKIKPGIIIKQYKIRTNIFNKINKSLDISFLQNYNYVNVISTSKGKGFAGVIKRHNFKSQRKTHGNSLSHRVTGSIGQNQTPGKVFKGKKMPGHMGNKKNTIKNLKIIKIYKDKQLLLVKGSISGPNNNNILIKLQDIK